MDIRGLNLFVAQDFGWSYPTDAWVGLYLHSTMIESISIQRYATKKSHNTQ